MKRSFRNLVLSASVMAACVVGLLCSCAPRVPVLDAAGQGDLVTLKKLLAEGHSINERNPKVQFGWTPLIGAIFQRETNVVHYLITAGADINLPDNGGETPLMWAAAQGDDALGIVGDLIAHGADLNAKDKMGATALNYAGSEPPKPKILQAVKAALARQQRK